MYHMTFISRNYLKENYEFYLRFSFSIKSKCKFENFDIENFEDFEEQTVISAKTIEVLDSL